MQPFMISVILSTYNMPHWLEKVLWGYQCQRYPYFELIVADDGSEQETHAVIKAFQRIAKIPVTHLWHADRGYRRQRILNKAIVTAVHDYLLFSDGDCIPRNDFLEVHARHAEKNRFLSGGYCKLPLALSNMISKADIASQRCFNLNWLRKQGLKGFSQMRKLIPSNKWALMMDTITPTAPTYNNCNVSAWKDDLLSVNGYDERMQYGGSDREIGQRLENRHITGKQIRHRAVCIHLYHDRTYKTSVSLEKNRLIRRQSRRLRRIKTPFGIERPTFDDQIS